MEKPKRNWAKGSRLTFLNSHLDAFKAARLQSLSKASEYIDQVVNEYFRRFDWRLPLTEEPTVPLNADAIPPMEILSAEELEKKAKIVAQMKTVRLGFSLDYLIIMLTGSKTIAAWLTYRTKKSHNIGKRATAENDPFTLFFAKLTGVGIKPPKARMPYQHWSKTHYDSVVKHDFEARFPKTGTRDKDRAANRVKVIQEHFDRLPEEERLRIADEAKADHKEAVKAWKEALSGAPSDDPHDRQE
jgi:hypothetical protein